MSLRKFISGVTAFAVAATAFAAMAVTASAENYSNKNISLTDDVANNFYNMAGYKSGIGTAKPLTNNAPYAGIRKDFSKFTDISMATSVTVEFDAAISSGDIVVFGFGDANNCTEMQSGSGTYKPEGRAIYFGSVDGSSYKAYDVKTGRSQDISQSAFGKVVHARVTLNRRTNTYSYSFSYTGGGISGTGQGTDINNLTYVDAYTKTSEAAFRFNNINVYYTVPSTLQPATWDLNGAPGYTAVEGNQIMKDGTSIYGYYADINSNGITYDIKADLYADDANNHAKGLELATLTGTGDVTVFVITNAALNSQSRVYCE